MTTNVVSLTEVSQDAVLEQEITWTRERLTAAKRSDVKRVYARAMTELIALRSPEQVARMERRKGLSK